MWALASPLILQLGAMFASSREQRRHAVVVTAVVGVAATGLHLAICAALALKLSPYWPEVSTSFGEAFATQLDSLLPLDILVFALLVFLGWALAVWRRARQLEVREAGLEAELARAKLEALRLEIQPHFLFNTLNAISALIRSGTNDRALEMLVKLGDLMRQTLDRHQEPLVPLAAEIAFTRQYVDLQMLRFGDRLQVHFHPTSASDDCLVPTLLLQPLVENAFRHGLARLRRPGVVEVAARIEGSALIVTVSDDGVGFLPGFSLEHNAHTGLGNTLSRLRKLFGSGASLELATRPGGGAIATVVLPVRRQAAEADVA